jgi:hypothetical protein
MWALGSAWPATDRLALADAIGGFEEVPGPIPCCIVATLLGTAALSMAGVPRSMPRATRLGSGVTSLVLCVRSGIGLAGKMPQSRRSSVFATLDRRIYSPLCFFLAVTALMGATAP